MKKIRLFIVFLLGFVAFLLWLSCLNTLEFGEKGSWISFVLAVASATACYVLARHWAAKDKLPDELGDERNDRA